MASIISGDEFTHDIWASLEDDIVENDIIQDVEADDSVGGGSEVPQDEHEAAEVDKIEDSEVGGLDINEKKQATKVKLSTPKNKKKRQADIGAETRKRKLLCQRVATTHGYSVKESLNEEIKSLFTGLLDSSFKSFMDIIGTKLETFKDQIVVRLDKLEGDVSGLKELIHTSGVTSDPPQVQSKSGVRKKKI